MYGHGTVSCGATICICIACYDLYTCGEHSPLYAIQRTGVCTPFASVYDCKDMMLCSCGYQMYRHTPTPLPLVSSHRVCNRTSVRATQSQRTAYKEPSTASRATFTTTRMHAPVPAINYHCCTSESSTALMCGAKKTRNLQTTPKTHQPPRKSGAKISTSAN